MITPHIASVPPSHSSVSPPDFNIRIKDPRIGTQRAFVGYQEAHKIGQIHRQYKNTTSGVIISQEEYKNIELIDKSLTKNMLPVSAVPYELIENLMKEMEALYESTKERLHIYNNREKKPTFIDEKTGETRPASEALTPDDEILNLLNDFCFHVNNTFTPEAIQVLHKRMKTDSEFKKKIDALRDLHVTAYEFFENKMLDRIFSLDLDTIEDVDGTEKNNLIQVKNAIYAQAGLKTKEIMKIKDVLNSDRILTREESEHIIQMAIGDEKSAWQELVSCFTHKPDCISLQISFTPEEKKTLKNLLKLNRDSTPEASENIIQQGNIIYQNNIKQKKINILESLSYDYHAKKAGELYKDISSDAYEALMIENYEGIIKPEIELLTQNDEKTGKPIFAEKDLKDKHLVFVGAGFPLSAVLQNIHTSIKITLVDLRQEACDNGNRILKILDILGVIKASDFNIIHKDALDLTYHKPTEENPSGTLNNSKDNNLSGTSSGSLSHASSSSGSSMSTSASTDSFIHHNAEIYADILQLAADLPEFVVQQVMNNQQSDIPFILKREGTTRSLYQPVSQPKYEAFKAKKLASTYNRKEAGLIVEGVERTVNSSYPNNRITTILYENTKIFNNEGEQK